MFFLRKTQDQVKKLIAGPDVCICDECIELCNEILDEELFNIKQDEKISDLDQLFEGIPKPAEIKAYLDEHIVGQQDAKRYYLLPYTTTTKELHTIWIQIMKSLKLKSKKQYSASGSYRFG